MIESRWSTGYELYIPIGVNQVNDSQYNQKFKIKDRYVYLYVDTISYYYKDTLNYKSDSDYDYYYKEIKLNDKNGYIGINKLDDGTFFSEVVYNYSKSEFYADDENLSFILANVLIMQNSIKYNDELIQEVIRLREKREPFEKNMGKGRRKGTYKLNDKQIQQVINMYQEGISKRQIAFKFKVSEKTVRNILKR